MWRLATALGVLLATVAGATANDLAVWRPSTGVWHALTSASGYTAQAAASQWGNGGNGDLPLVGDLDGDGNADKVVWRASTGTWYWLKSSTGYDPAQAGIRQWGSQSQGDVPLLADMDGDRRSDLVVWRASTGTWLWLTSSSAYATSVSKQWGNLALGDKPLAADVDGDHRAELVVWRASTGTWYWLTSSSGYSYAASRGVQWGSVGLGDVPKMADMDGDARADLVIWRASTGTWYWLTSRTGYSYTASGGKQWGNSALGDKPVAADLDGDNIADLAVWRASTGTWFWLKSSHGYSYAASGIVQWGASSDVPLTPARFRATTAAAPTPTPAPAPTPTPTPSPTGTELRVLVWNTHHGVGTDNVYNIDRIATWAASMRPDVIMFNEIEKNTYWGREDQPEVYKRLLQQKTGKTWYYMFAQEYGDWNANGKGNMIMSTYPINGLERYEMVHNADRSIAMAWITVNSRMITLLNTHLDPYDQALRLLQATEVTTWSAMHPENRILTGDMNAWPDQTSIAQITKTYNDSWAVALSKGTAIAFPGNNGETKNGRIDYIFYSKYSTNLTVKSSQVPDTRDASGVMPSDHRPVLTTFIVK